MDEIVIPKEFIEDAVEFPAFIVKVYLYLKYLADTTREATKSKENSIWIRISYDTIYEKTQISKPSARQSILILAEKGWINGFKRGYRDVARGNKSNEYRIPFVRTYDEAEYYKMLIVHKEKPKEKGKNKPKTNHKKP